MISPSQRKPYLAFKFDLSVYSFGMYESVTLFDLM